MIHTAISALVLGLLTYHGAAAPQTCSKEIDTFNTCYSENEASCGCFAEVTPMTSALLHGFFEVQFPVAPPATCEEAVSGTCSFLQEYDCCCQSEVLAMTECHGNSLLINMTCTLGDCGFDVSTNGASGSAGARGAGVAVLSGLLFV